MRKMLTLAAGCFILLACNNSKPADTTTSSATDTTSPVKDMKPKATEFADPKYAELGKKNLDQLSSGDIDGWMSSYAEKAHFNW